MLPQLTKEANIRVDNDLFISFYRDEILLLFSGFPHFLCKNVSETLRFLSLIFYFQSKL